MIRDSNYIIVELIPELWRTWVFILAEINDFLVVLI